MSGMKVNHRGYITMLDVVDKYTVIDWLDEFIASIGVTRNNLKAAGIVLSKRWSKVEHLLGRDLQQRTLNQLVEQRITIRLRERTQHLYLLACHQIRKDLHSRRFNGARWIQENQITSKASLKEYLKKLVMSENVEHFKEYNSHLKKIKLKSSQMKETA